MYPPRWFLPVDVVISLVITVVSMGIAIYSLHGFRWVKERSLHFLYLAFTLLAIGFFANGLTFGYAYLAKVNFARASTALAVADLGLWIFYLLSIAAYFILVYAYWRNVREISIATAAVSALVLWGPILDAVLVILIFVIVFAQATHFSMRRSKNAVIVTGSFALILLSQILLLMGNIDANLYVGGKVLELFAFLALLYPLIKMRRPA